MYAIKILVTASSLILKDFKSLYSATVNKLIEEGAIVIGRLNCDEFAMGSANENTVYGPVKNPHDIQKLLEVLLAVQQQLLLLGCVLW